VRQGLAAVHGRPYDPATGLKRPGVSGRCPARRAGVGATWKAPRGRARPCRRAHRFTACRVGHGRAACCTGPHGRTPSEGVLIGPTICCSFDGRADSCLLRAFPLELSTWKTGSKMTVRARISRAARTTSVWGLGRPESRGGGVMRHPTWGHTGRPGRAAAAREAKSPSLSLPRSSPLPSRVGTRRQLGKSGTRPRRYLKRADVGTGIGGGTAADHNRPRSRPRRGTWSASQDGATRTGSRLLHTTPARTRLHPDVRERKCRARSISLWISGHRWQAGSGARYLGRIPTRRIAPEPKPERILKGRSEIRTGNIAAGKGPQPGPIVGRLRLATASGVGLLRPRRPES